MLLEIIGNHEPANRSSVQKGSMAPFPVCIRVHLSMKKNGVWIQNWTSAHNRGGPLCYGVPVPALVILPNVGIPESPQNQEEICKRFWNSSAKWPEKNRPKFDPGIPWSRVEALHFLDGHQRWVHGATFCGEGAAGMVMFSWFGGSINRGTPSHHPFLFGIFPFKPSSFWVFPWLWKRPFDHRSTFCISVFSAPNYWNPTTSFLAPPRWKM
jgi:hypothetical protein